MKKQTKTPNRLIWFTSNGLGIEADPRQDELVIKELDLEKSKGLSTPVVDEPIDENGPDLCG